MSYDSDDSMSSDSSIDLAGQESTEYLYKNPLSRIRLYDDIDHLVSPHLGRRHFSPFTKDTVKSDAARVFYTSFFLGVLTTYESLAASGLYSIHHRSSKNTLELAAVYSKGSRVDVAALHIHEIKCDWNNPSAANEAEEIDENLRIGRIQAIKEKLQPHLNIKIAEAYIYQYEMNERSVSTDYENVGMELELTNRASFDLAGIVDRVNKADEKAASEYLPVKNVELNDNEHWAQFIHNVLPDFEAMTGEPSMERMSEIVYDSVEALFHTRMQTWSEFSSMTAVGASDLGFLHGALFAAMPDKYYKRLLQTDLPAVYYTGQDALLYFGSSRRTPHKHIIVDLDTRTVNFRHGYIFVKKLKELDDEARVEEIRYINDEIGGMLQRTVRWNLYYVITNLNMDVWLANQHHVRQMEQNHIAEDFEKNHVTLLEENYLYYSQLMQDMLSDTNFGNKITSLQTLKAFLYGQLVTNMDVAAMISTQGFQISSADGQDTYYMTFGDERKETNIQELIQTHRSGNRLCIEFNFDDRQIGWHVTSVNPDYMNLGGLGPMLNVDLRETLKQMVNSGHMHENDLAGLRRTFHDQLQSLLRTMKHRFAAEGTGDSFLAGALSNIGLKKFYSYANHYGTMLIHSALSLGSERFFFNWITLYGSKIDPAKLAIENANNEDNTFTIVNKLDLQDDTVEVAASSSRQRQFNTDNVNKLCRRSKRNLVSYCEIGNKEKEEKIDFEDIHQCAQEKYPALSEHLSILHEVSGKLQLGFIGRDIIGDLYQNDMAGLARDALFFGAISIGSKIGRSVAAVGQGLKAAGKTILGGVIETVGGCAAMLGFDLYMGYQMKEEIKRNDTKSAIYSGAYIGMDLIECGAIAAAAFGLTSVIPEITAVISVFRVITVIAQNVQEMKHKIREIEAIVPLTPGEETYESFREFFHLGMDARIESMVNEVTANEAVVNNIIDKYPSYNRYLTSAASTMENGRIIFIDDNTVDLSKTYRFIISTLMPRHSQIPKDISLLCSMNEADNTQRRHSKKSFGGQAHPFVIPAILPEPKPYTNSIDDFLCKNAFGVEKVNGSGKTIYLLYNGTDNVVASPTTDSNVFLLMNGNKSIEGGLGTDVFAIRADYIFGYLNGSSGEDTVDFSASDGTKYLIIKNGEASLIPKYGDNNFKLLLYNIETVIGRSKLSDYIEVCREKMVDLRGADNGIDRINITNNCPAKERNLTIILRKNTFIICDAQDSLTKYIVTDESNTDLFLNAGKHELQIKSASYFDLVTQHSDEYSRVMEFPQSKIIMTLYTFETANVTFHFLKENLTMKIDDQNNITLYLHGANSIFDVVEQYAEHVEKNLHVNLIASGDYGTIVLKHNLLTVDFAGRRQMLNMISNGHTNTVQMIGHSGVDNYFWISATLNKTINITIHPQLSKLSHCYIDLHNLTREINRVRNGSLGLFVRSQVKANDIILNIFATSSGMKIDDIIQIGTIKIINSVNYMRQITVYLYGRNVFSKNARLEPLPILTNQTFLTVLPGQIEFESQINFNYPAPNLTAYRMDASLLLSNVVTAKESTSQQPVTIVLSDYSTYRAKYETLSLIFDGHVLNVEELSRFVQSIKFMWKRIKDALNEAKSDSNIELENE